MKFDALTVETPQSNTSSSFYDLSNELKNEMEILGVESYLFATFDKDNKRDFIINGYPKEWREKYDLMRYKDIDPVVDYTMRNCKPILWKELKREKPKNTIIFDEAEKFGLNYGWTIPLHSAKGNVSLLSFASEQESKLLKLNSFESNFFNIYYTITKITEESERSLYEQESKINKKFNISEQEKEVIKWAAEGKTIWETSKIMSLAQDTVKFHLKKICTKLNANNKVNAVYKSIIHGIL